VLAVKDGDAAKDINPNSGFPSYGFVRNDYILVKGSVPGPAKRMVKLRLARRAKPGKEPALSFVSLEPR